MLDSCARTQNRVYGPRPLNKLDLMGIRFMADNDDAGEGAGDLSAEELAALGDPGKQAIARMKGQLGTTKTELKAYADLGLTPAQIKALIDAKPAEPKPAAPKPAGDTVDESAIEQRVRAAIETETATREAVRSRAAEVRAQAAELNFIKPVQALALLDPAKLAAVKVDPATGDADTAAVKNLLDELAKDSPHLLKPTDTTPGHIAAGIGGTGSGARPDVLPGTPRMANAYANSPKK